MDCPECGHWGRSEIVSEVPFCRDCLYYQASRGPFEYCCHPDLATLDLVSGKLLSQRANTARSSPSRCGPPGLLFEAKPPKPLRWYQRVWR